MIKRKFYHVLEAFKTIYLNGAVIRKLLLIILLVFFSVFMMIDISIKSKVSILSHNMQDLTIVIDPGHGGVDGGASVDNNLLEKDINLDIALKLKALLQKSNIEVIMTRDSDVSLESKSDLDSSMRYKKDLDARKNIIDNADIFISIHTNCIVKRPSAKGAIIFYYEDSPEGKKLGSIIAGTIDKIVYKAHLRIDSINTKVLPERYYILRTAKAIGVLIEVGFLTNDEENKLLKQQAFRSIMAEAIYEGIVEYALSQGYFEGTE